jgi:hypothetical protein
MVVGLPTQGMGLVPVGIIRCERGRFTDVRIVPDPKIYPFLAFQFTNISFTCNVILRFVCR